MTNLIYLRPRNGVEKYFRNKEAYRNYLRLDAALQQEPLEAYLDWKRLISLLVWGF